MSKLYFWRNSGKGTISLCLYIKKRIVIFLLISFKAKQNDHRFCLFILQNFRTCYSLQALISFKYITRDFSTSFKTGRVQSIRVSLLHVYETLIYCHSGILTKYFQCPTKLILVFLSIF